MDSMLEQIESWFAEDKSVALATVIKTWGSSPRPVGALMAISDQGDISGSVSGGCVEGAVLEAGLEVIQTGKPVQLHFGVADQEAWQVGLSCGGEIEVFLRSLKPENVQAWRTAAEREVSYFRLMVIQGSQELKGTEWFVPGNGEPIPDPSQSIPPDAVILEAAGGLSDRETGLLEFPGTDYQVVFYHQIRPPRTLVIVGGVHIAIPLASLAEILGYEVIVIDPRRLFGREERFPEVKTLLQVWPQQAFQQISLTGSTAVVMLTHDPKIDDPALIAALNSPAFYVGALGSRTTHQKRLQRLEQEHGMEPDLLDRIHAPIGLDLGGSSPEEIALAVMAEIVSTWHEEGG